MKDRHGWIHVPPLPRHVVLDFSLDPIVMCLRCERAASDGGRCPISPTGDLHSYVLRKSPEATIRAIIRYAEKHRHGMKRPVVVAGHTA